MEKLKTLLDKELDSFLVKIPENRKSALSYSNRLTFILENLKELEFRLVKVYVDFHNENKIQIQNEDFKKNVSDYLKKFINRLNH